MALPRSLSIITECVCASSFIGDNCADDCPVGLTGVGCCSKTLTSVLRCRVKMGDNVYSLQPTLALQRAHTDLNVRLDM